MKIIKGEDDERQEWKIIKEEVKMKRRSEDEKEE